MINLKPAWDRERVQGQSELHSKTISRNKTGAGPGAQRGLGVWLSSRALALTGAEPGVTSPALPPPPTNDLGAWAGSSMVRYLPGMQRAWTCKYSPDTANICIFFKFILIFYKHYKLMKVDSPAQFVSSMLQCLQQPNILSFLNLVTSRY